MDNSSASSPKQHHLVPPRKGASGYSGGYHDIYQRSRYEWSSPEGEWKRERERESAGEEEDDHNDAFDRTIWLEHLERFALVGSGGSILASL